MYAFVPNKLFGSLLEMSPANVTLKNLIQRFHILSMVNNIAIMKMHSSIKPKKKNEIK